MRKFLSIIILLLICTPAFSEDMWDNFGDQNVYGQEAVSDQDFEKALKSKQKKKKRDKNIPKGESFQQSNETDAIINTSKEPDILLIPLELKSSKDEIIPVGHYEVTAEKEGEQIFFKLSQSHSLIAKIQAEETDDDFNEETIRFVKLLPHGENHVQIIFGGLDFNAYAIVDIMR